MKYNELTLGQIEAVVNKLGGMDGVKRLLATNRGFSYQQPPQLFMTDVEKKYGFGELTLLYNTPRRIVPGGKVEVVAYRHWNDMPAEQQLWQEAVELGACLGQMDAEWLLQDPSLIPDSHDLWFPGTQYWSRQAGRVCVPVISEGKLCFNFLNGQDYLFVRPAPPRNPFR